jgi:outer membrane protein assembly factor BamB
MIGRSIAVAVVLAVLGICGAARAQDGGYEVRWKLAATAGVWPPALGVNRVVLKTGDTLSAYGIDRGQLLWTQRLSDLRYGEGVLAACDGQVYVLSATALHVLDGASGRSLRSHPLPAPSSLLCASSSVYVVASDGVHRLDATASKELRFAKGWSGELRGADGDTVALYREVKPGARESPKRLVVVDLRRNKATFEFRLLPRGGHQVVKFEGGRIVFLDYTLKQRDGGNPRSLFYTEADYQQGKKLKDVSLRNLYASAASDGFRVASGAGGRLFLGNHGGPGDPSSLHALDPAEGRTAAPKTIWTRSGEVISSGLLLQGGKLWTALARKDESVALAYNPEDGNLLVRQALDAPATGSPVAVGSAVLFRTRSSVYCFAPRAATPPPPPAPLPTEKTPTGWRLFRDKAAGYFIQLPTSWRFDRAGMKTLGGVRYVIPFLRAGTVGGRAVSLGSIHILTWEAAGRDADGLWRSVHAQRLRTSPTLRVVQVQRIANVGGSGVAGVLATYSFQHRSGHPVQMRSLCAVSHGVAFELRAWASPLQPKEIWQEVEAIFGTFRPHRF